MNNNVLQLIKSNEEQIKHLAEQNKLIQKILLIGGFNETSLDIEYKRWKITNYTLRKILSKTNNKYEMSKIYERYLLNSCNIADVEHVYVQKPLDHFLYKNIIYEITSIKIGDKKFANKIAKYIKNSVDYFFNSKTKKAPKIHQHNNMFICGKFKMKIPSERLAKFPKNKEIIMLMMLRYKSMAIGSQQWALPLQWYRYLVKKYNADIEGFASPLNSRFILIKDNPRFCSLHLDTDAPFGSIGNIFKLKSNDIKNKTMINNPPYVLEIMNKLSKIQESWLSKVPVRIIMTVSSWTDAEYFINSKKSKYLIYDEELPKYKHFYETIKHGKKEKIIAKFPSHFFVFSSMKNDNSKKYKKMSRFVSVKK